MTAALKAGQDWLAERLGVSPSRLRQCANPHRVVYDRAGRARHDSLPLHLACECDIATAAAGLGTPLFDAYRRRLIAAGALARPPFERRAVRLAEACRAAAELLLAALNPLGAGAGRAAARGLSLEAAGGRSPARRPQGAAA